MKFGIQPLIFRIDAKTAASVDVHGLSGIESGVIFVEFLAVHNGFSVGAQFHRLVNAGNIGAVDGVHTSVNQIDICARRGGVHIFCSIFCVGAAAFVHVIENNCRSDRAADIGIVQIKIYHCVGVIFCIVSQINGNLTGRELAAELIITRIRDVDNGVFVGFFLAVGIILGTFTVGEILSLQIKDNVVCRINSRIFIVGDGFTIDGDFFVGQGDGCTAESRIFHRQDRGIGRSFRRECFFVLTGTHGESHRRRKQQRECAFHKYSS